MDPLLGVGEEDDGERRRRRSFQGADRSDETSVRVTDRNGPPRLRDVRRTGCLGKDGQDPRVVG